MNSVMGINATTPNVTFGNKMSKAERKALEMIDMANEKLALEKMKKERPEEYRIVMQNRINQAMLDATSKIFSPKNLIKMGFDSIRESLTYGLAKLINSCNKTLNKIPFVKNARDKRFAKIEESIMKRFEDGAIDADQAGEMLIKANPNIKKV